MLSHDLHQQCRVTHHVDQAELITALLSHKIHGWYYLKKKKYSCVLCFLFTDSRQNTCDIFMNMYTIKFDLNKYSGDPYDN